MRDKTYSSNFRPPSLEELAAYNPISENNFSTQLELRPNLNFHDPLLDQLEKVLHGKTQNESLLDSLYAESVAHTMKLHVLRHYSNSAFMGQSDAGQLSVAQLRIVNEYIYTHLHQKISLADLAACIYMSVSHFERMFRVAVHCPPYRYVMERRIEKAKFLLLQARLTVYEVGCECGFANQSHFTRHFTRLVGLSPARFRQARLMENERTIMENERKLTNKSRDDGNLME